MSIPFVPTNRMPSPHFGSRPSANCCGRLPPSYQCILTAGIPARAGKSQCAIMYSGAISADTGGPSAQTFVG